MAITLAWYSDSGLTAPLASLQVTQADDGTSPAVDRVVYLGSTAAGKQFQAASDPGVDDVVVSIADSAAASGVEAEHIKLALSSGGLDTAVAGDPLTIGTEILSGVVNAVAVHVRVDTPALASGTYTDIELRTNTLIEVDAA